MKKLLIVSVLALTMGVASVSALTDAQMNSILDMLGAFGADSATIANVEAALKGEATTPTTPATGVPAACAGISFTRNLTQGASGADVKCLQALLNLDTATQVAATGVGSKGNETEYFGSLTAAAVVKFQNKYASEVLAPVGLTAGTGFVGAQTRAKLNAMLAAAPVTDPDDDPVDDETISVGETDVTVTALAVPNNVAVKQGEENVAVMAIEFKAEDADAHVRRIDLTFDTDITGGERPARSLDYISLYDGANAVSGQQAVSDNFRRDGTDYRMRFDGLNIVIPAGTKKTIYVKVSASEVGETGNFQIDIVADSGIRITDGVGINHYNSSTLTKTFSVGETDDGAIQVVKNANTPDEGIELVSVEDDTEGIELLKFELRVTKKAVTLEDIRVTVNVTASAADADEVIKAVHLYDGSTLIGTESISSAGHADFENLDYSIAKDVNKVLTVKVDVYSQETYEEEGVILAASVNSTSIVAIDADDEDTTDSGSATGENIYLYTVAPVISNISTSMIPVLGADNAIIGGDAKITFTLTAKGGDITLVPASDISLAPVASAGGTITAQYYEVDGVEYTGTDDIEILEDQSVVVVVEARVGANSGVRVSMEIDGLDWEFEDADSVTQNGEMPSELLKDLKTGNIIIL